VQKHALGAGTDMKSEKVKWFQKHMNHDLNWNNDFWGDRNWSTHFFLLQNRDAICTCI